MTTFVEILSATGGPVPYAVKYFQNLNTAPVFTAAGEVWFDNIVDPVSGQYLQLRLFGSSLSYNSSTQTLSGTIGLIEFWRGPVSGGAVNPTDQVATAGFGMPVDANNLFNAIKVKNAATLDSLLFQADAFDFKGNNGADAFTGRALADTMQGGGGNDTLDGGAGVDLLDYRDLVSGQNLTLTLGALTASSGAVAETIATVSATSLLAAQSDKVKNFENVYGGAGDDKITGNAAKNTLQGWSGSDRLDGGANDDDIDGGNGDDLLIGGAGADLISGGTIFGPATSDTVSYVGSVAAVDIDLNRNDDVNVGDSQIQIGGDAQGDKLFNIKNIVGSAFADKLRGDDEDNTFIGGAGADNIKGAAGSDTVDYRNQTAALTIDLRGYAALTGGEAAGDRLGAIENILSGKGADTLTGNRYANYIYGNDGNDLIEGGAAADRLNGGLGVDTVSYASSAVGVQIDLNNQGGLFPNGEEIPLFPPSGQIGGDASGDKLWGFENVTGSASIDFLIGTTAINTILGGAGDDQIFGRGGGDTLDGGAGVADLVDYSSRFTVALTTNLTITLGTWNSTTGASAQTMVTVAPGQIDKIANFENVYGGDGADRLTGNAANNELRGGRGNDILIGGGGADVLDGRRFNPAAPNPDPEADTETDTVSYAGSALGVNVDLSKNKDNSVLASLAQIGGDAEGDKLANVNILIGSAQNDTLIGWAGGNTAVANRKVVIDGGAGNDLIGGMTAGNRVIGGAGNDTLSYAAIGFVSDNTSAGVFVDLRKQLTFDASYGPNVPAGLDLNDFEQSFGNASLNLLSGIENLVGGSGADTLVGDDNVNVIEGGAGTDELDGRGGIDTISYRSSNVAGVVVNLANQGTYDSAGNRILPAPNQAGGHAQGDQLWGFENVEGSALGDLLSGNISKNTLSGGGGGDILHGFGGADTILGGLGDDQVTLAYGGDTIDGGDGDADAVYGFAATQGVTITLGVNGTNTGYAASRGATGIVITNVEHLYATSFNDILTGNNKSNQLFGLNGDDTLSGLDGDDTIQGNDSNDTLIGGSGNDDLDGGDGNDVLNGGAGADDLNGGDGRDTATYAGSSAGVILDLIVGDSLNGDAQDDEFVNIENFIGSAKNDTIIADGTIENWLDGSAGSDTVDYSQAGLSSGIVVNLSKQFDPVTFAAGPNTLAVIGTGGTGDRLANFENVIGTANNDKLYGNGSDNTFEGGAGGDELVGGTGVDTVSYRSSASTVVVSLTQQGQFDFATGVFTGGIAQTGGDAASDKLAGFENIEGSNAGGAFFGDNLTGDESKNTIWGLDGGDLISGGGGADTIFGGAGFDTIIAGTGDIIDGGEDFDRIQGWQTATGAAVTQGVTVALGNGGAKAVVSRGAAGIVITNVESLYGTNFDDELTGNIGTNDISGFSGNDTISGGDGDPAIPLLDDDRLLGGNGNDTLNGNGGIDELYGEDDNDVLNGNAGGDRLYGGLGNDVLEGGAGTDLIYGYMAGSGTPDAAFRDTARYASSLLGITIDMNLVVADNGVGQAQLGGDPLSDSYGDQLFGIEDITGSSKDDLIIAAENNEENRFDGGLGNDTISYAELNDGLTIDLSLQFTSAFSSAASPQAVTINGTAGGDKIANIENVIGTSDADVITGSTKDNVIEGGVGFDTMRGGGGTDMLSYADSAAAGVIVALNGATAAAIVTSTGGDADGDIATGFINLRGSALGDTLLGDSRANLIEGGDGADFLFGNANNADADGADILRGQGGSDQFFADLGADTLDGGEGSDQVNYSTVGDAITIVMAKGSGTTTVSSKAGNAAAGDKLIGVEHIVGGSGINTLTGSDFRVQFEGGSANDILTGSTVADVLYGNNGNDTFYMTTGADVMSGDGGVDTLNASNLTAGVTINLQLGTTTFNNTNSIASIENVIGTNFNDTITGNRSNGGVFLTSRLDGAAGNDLIVVGSVSGASGSRAEFLGGAGADTLSFEVYSGVRVDLAKQGNANGTRTGVVANGAATGRVLVGFNDYYAAEFENLIGTADNDFLFGDGFANVIDGGAEADELDGRGGIDTVNYANSDANVRVDLTLQGIRNSAGTTTTVAQAQTGGGSGNSALGDTLYGFENITGSAFDDILTGDGFANVIDGGVGNDTLRGGGGGDTFVGGTGIDYVDYALEANAITLTLGANGASATVAQTGAGLNNAAGDKLISIENIDGGNGNDRLTGNNIAHRFSGGDGNDTLIGGTGDSSLSGGNGDDTIIASTGGFETYFGGSNTSVGDTLSFAAFTSNLVVDFTTDSANPLAGIGSLLISGIENLISGSGHDSIKGSSAAERLDGGAGDDVIEGRAGADALVGGVNGALGDTVSYLGSTTGVTVSLATQGTYNATTGVITGATAQIGGDAAGDLLSGFENLIGSDGGISAGDNLTGNANANRIEGRSGVDAINGGAGDDILIGGQDSDGLTSGAGNDRFVFEATNNGTDNITDFTTGDKIQINKATFSGLSLAGLGSLTADYFVSDSDPVANATGHGQFLFDTDLANGSTQLLWDNDGAGGSAGQLIAAFSNGHLLVLSDFVLV